MTFEEFKVQHEMLLEDYSTAFRSYLFANKPEDRATLWTLRGTIKEKLHELGRSYRASQNIGVSVQQIPSVTNPVRKRRNLRDQMMVTAFGRKQTLVAWAKELGMSRATLYSRIYQLGWKAEEALNDKPRIVKSGPRKNV